jgi:hypothetical protein
MPRSFIVVSGTNIGVKREWALSATDALQLVFDYKRLRRTGVSIEDRLGNPITYFQLKALAEDESWQRASRS